MKEKNHTELIARYLAGDLSSKEEQGLMIWVEANESNQKLFDELVEVWSFTGEHKPEIKVNTADAWSKVASKLETNPASQVSTSNIKTSTTKSEAKVVSINKWAPLLRIAAVTLLIFGATFWMMNKGGDEISNAMLVAQTMNDERKEVNLPDGSKVWLNQNSSLSYNESFSLRTLELKGEAFFDVQKKNGQPFEIISGDAKTTVLGTSFNVRAYPDEGKVEVTVETGKVALENNIKSNEKVLLVAGESGSFDKPKQTVKKVADKISNANAWRTRELVFSENIKVSQIVNDMERYFGIKIAAKPEILRCTFTPGTSKNPKAKDILDVMAYGLNLKIEKTPNGYELLGEGCR